MSDDRDDVWMISVDDHLIEPPDTWVDRLPTRYRESGPRWFQDDQGEAWHYEDVRQPVGGAVTSGAFWPPENRPPAFQPLAWSEVPPACYDPAARADAMDRDHVLAAAMFPNLPGFAGGLFVRAKDKDLARLCVEAYNDWILDEWCATLPGRIIAIALVPMWDGRLAAAEAERVISRGARAISFSMAPHNLGLPPIHDQDGFWDPLFSVVNEAGVPLCTHLGTGFGGDLIQALQAAQAEPGGAGAPQEGLGAALNLQPAQPRVAGMMLQLAGQTTLLEWLFSGNFERYPNLKLCLSENGIGWIPAVLQLADWMTEMTRERVTHFSDPENDPALTEEEQRAAQASLDRRAADNQGASLPGDLFRDHVYGCFIHDPVGLRMLDYIGADNVMIETDFPHNSTWWPHSMDKAREWLTGLSAEVQEKVLRGNAERVFGFTAAGPPPSSLRDPA